MQNTNKLNAYKITFTGRLKGAIGKQETFSDIAYGDTEQMALLNLYDKYDCIHLPKIKLIK